MKSPLFDACWAIIRNLRHIDIPLVIELSLGRYNNALDGKYTKPDMHVCCSIYTANITRIYVAMFASTSDAYTRQTVKTSLDQVMARTASNYYHDQRWTKAK